MTEFLQYKLFEINNQAILLENFFFAFLILFGLPLAFWLFKRFVLNRYYKRKNMDEGRVYSFNQLLKYVVYIIALLWAVQTLGFKLSVIWAAGAALLVGIGLGLQQTFNDFASGIILLMEGTVQKGDWIEIGNTIGEVDKIGLRTSIITTRKNISIIVPNSKITVDNVINLSHNNKIMRHEITIGVAYGSDTQLVKKLLLECAQRHSKVLPGAFVRFVGFGQSSLDFELLFWSSEYKQIEDVKSDLRFMMDTTFRKNGVSIPFPQRDLNIKSFVSSELLNAKAANTRNLSQGEQA